MKSEIVINLLKLAASFLPFVLFAYLNGKANTKKEFRHRQYLMPVLAVIYSVVLLIFLDKISQFLTDKFYLLAGVFDKIRLSFIGDWIRDLYTSWGIYLSLVLFNTAALLAYVILKRFITVFLGQVKVDRNSFIGKVVDLFYTYDELDDRWYIKEHYGQARTFIKTVYYGSCFASGLALLISCGLCMRHLVSAPFYPVFAVIIIGEMAFFIEGTTKDEVRSDLSVQADNSRHIAMYPLLRKPLKALFGDKLAADGTTVNNGGVSGGAIEDILVSMAETDHVGKNYATFIRQKMVAGLKPNVDYVRSGYDLATGKSLLFNTPFYDKLNPYIFYAMNRELLTGGKILIVLGRHGTEEDLRSWTDKGMQQLSNIPDLWKINVLTNKVKAEDELPDIGIISRSGVHDLDIHKSNLFFLRKVSFVVVIEPSRLVTTAQIGLNLLIKCCGKEKKITFCSVDRNCDGLVDALSHILMTNITEVSATEYPPGMSSFMYWTADDDYLQHRILPGVSRCLGMGTELSMVALRNQVRRTVWYGEEAFPVQDARWIAKQYYHDLLDYAQLPTNQETFDKSFQTSFNMCDERVSDFSFITVEDDRNNLFEMRRNFATIAQQQGFVNVISSEYMLREYMAENPELFTADAKAIPYITADYARTKRNVILSMCLLLCIDSVPEDVLDRQMAVMNIETDDPVSVLWKEICVIFGHTENLDKQGAPILEVKTRDGRTVRFEKHATIFFKRAYSVESGKFESVYTIENSDFSRMILDDLQNASYIAEQEDRDVYIGTELKGHVYQKYMPGQFFTLNGKYYEMVSTATDNRILVRRASEHIGGRLSYRQIRNYTIHRMEDADSMGALKTVNNIHIHYQYADFSVDTPGYWKLRSHNDFDNGDLVKVNGVPKREYYHKQILKFDFSHFGDAFTDEIRMTLTNLLNEAFVTLFAENQHFISAITPGEFGAPLTYNLAVGEGVEAGDKCIFIIEDSQLDIGLLIAVERNVNRILQIVADYLAWNDEKIQESLRKQNEPAEEHQPAPFNVYEEASKEPKKGKVKKFFQGIGNFFKRIGGWFKKLFKRKKKGEPEENQENPEQPAEGLTPKEQKKAEKKAARAEKKANREAAKAEKKAAKAASDAEKQAAKEQKKAEKAAKKAEKAARKAAEKEAAEQTASEEATAEPEAASEEATAQEPSEEVASQEEESTEIQTEGEVSEDA